MDCIYLSAGLGVRMKESQPKQFLTLLGKPIFMYALEVLEQMPEIGRILLVYHVDYKDLYLRYLDRYNISKVELVEGGRSRQQSVFNGLLKASTKRVLIHEAARPFITSESILEMIAMEKEIAVIPTIPIPYTVSTGGDYMDGVLDRGRLHNVQLPQIFSTAALTAAHERAMSDHFEANEDGVLIFRNGGLVRFVPGSENNIKITTPLDLIIAEKMIRGVYQ
jgi:2-C-methyl-D-erythritol 4-phosphate cytidylyltransferase